MHTTFSSPIGSLTLRAENGALTGVWMEDDDLPEHIDDTPPLDQARRQLEAYFAGELREFDLPLAPAGSEFQLRVWRELAKIPYGETISYGELASRVGDPTKARAVGAANGRNPLSIVVPCHRVVGANGSLTGFGGGLGAKAWLLDHEKRVLSGS